MSGQLLTRPQRSFSRGMNDTAEPDEYRPDEVAALYNARVSYDGDAAERRGGSERKHGTALNSGAQCYGACEFYDASSTKFKVAIFGDTAFYSTDDGATWTTGLTGLPTGAWDFTAMKSGASRILIMVNGSGAPRTFDGTTWGTLTGTSIPTGATVCEYHNNRLWLWGHNGPIMQGSRVNDPTDFSGTFGVLVQAETSFGDPQPRGLWGFGTALLAFTLDQVGYVEGWGINTVTVETGHRGMSKTLGCVSFRTIQQAGEDGLIWLSKLGWVYWRQGGAPQLISGQIQRFVQSLAWDNIIASPETPSAAWYPYRGEYHCAVPSTGNSQNTHTVVIRPPLQSRPLAIWVDRSDDADDGGLGFAINDGVLEMEAGGREAIISGGVLELQASGTPGTLVVVTDGVLSLAVDGTIPATLFSADHDAEDESGVLWSGGYDGFVRRMDRGDMDDVLSDGTGGRAINAWVRTRPETGGDQFRRKKVRGIRASVKAPNGGALTVAPVTDGQPGTALAKTLAVQEVTQAVRTRVTGRGFVHQADLRFTDDITIQGAELNLVPLRERL